MMEYSSIDDKRACDAPLPIPSFVFPLARLRRHFQFPPIVSPWRAIPLPYFSSARTCGAQNFPGAGPDLETLRSEYGHYLMGCKRIILLCLTLKKASKEKTF